MHLRVFDLRIVKNEEWSKWRRSECFSPSASFLHDVISNVLLVCDLLLCRSKRALKVVFSVHNSGLKVA